MFYIPVESTFVGIILQQKIEQYINVWHLYKTFRKENSETYGNNSDSPWRLMYTIVLKPWQR